MILPKFFYTPFTKTLGMSLVGSLAIVVSLVAQAAQDVIEWDNLQLTSTQKQCINQAESQWKNTYSQLHPQLLADKQELKRLLNSPDADPQLVMALQQRIQQNEQRLSKEAMHCFLSKKKTLSTEQQKKLQNMMRQQGF